MEQLKALHRDPEISLYQISGEESGEVEEYIFSTPETRNICNRPELVGIDFPLGMRSAKKKLFQLSPLQELVGDAGPLKSAILHFLRGGLNFQIREALNEAYGFTRQYCSYMTSQRYQRGKRWKIKQDQYRKIDYISGSTMLIGDCVATGSTMENGLEVLLDFAREQQRPISNLVVFTIGCRRAREILENFHKRFAREFDYERTMVFYVEGRFKLASEDMGLSIALPGTDLLKASALLAPEYERTIYERLHIPLERCAIYDLGAKSFTYREHVDEVIGYWEQLKASSLTLREAYRERWPETDYRSFQSLLESRRSVWPFVEETEIKQLYELYKERWEDTDLLKEVDTHAALEKLAERRIKLMTSQLNE